MRAAQGRAPIDDKKERIELVVRGRLSSSCEARMPSAGGGPWGLLLVAVGAFGYQGGRGAEPLRRRLAELTRKRPRFGCWGYG